jgi:hypothetical protein
MPNFEFGFYYIDLELTTGKKEYPLDFERMKKSEKERKK